MKPDEDEKTSNSTAKQELEVAEIDAKILEHFKTISELRRRRNILVPSISRLPPEILTHIFSFLVRESVSAWFWTVVTHVCSLWRQITLNTPELWSYITSLWRQDIKVLLDRSKATDLSLRLSSPNLFMEQVVSSYKMTLLHLSRVRELEMSDILCVNNKWLEIHSDVTAEPLRLRKLCITLGEHMALSIPDLSIDCSKFIESAPMLEYLTLRGCHFSWSNFRFENLSELTLDAIKPEEKMPTVAETLHILASSPKLEKLTLVGVGALVDTTDFDFEVKMPNLRSLKFCRMKPQILRRLLGCLKFSHELNWDIECFNYLITDPQNLCPTILVPKDKSPITMKITLFTQKIIIESFNEMDNETTKSSGRLSLCWQGLFNGPEYSQKICNALSITIGSHFWNEAEDLEISFFDVDTCILEEGWGKLLHSFGHLESIACNFSSYSTDDSSENGLACFLMQSVSSHSKTIVHSDLNILRLHFAHFFEDENPFKDLLLQCLKHRQEHGARTLATLEICKGIGIIQKSIDELKLYVKELSWDGLNYADDDMYQEPEDDEDYEDEDEYADSFTVGTDDMFDSDNDYF